MGAEMQQRILRLLIPACAAAAALEAVTNYMGGRPETARILALAAVGCLAAFVLLRRGLARTAGVALVWMMIAAVHLILQRDNGLHDTGLILYPLVMVVAAVLFDRILVMLTALLCVASVGVVVHQEVTGRLVTPLSHRTSYQDLLDVAVVVVITGLAMRLLIEGLGRSIAEAQRQREELRASEARWRSLVRHAPDRIVSVDRELLIRMINDDPPDSSRPLLGRPIAELTTAEHQPRLEAAVRAAFESGEPSRMELPGWGAEGQPAWYAVRVGPVQSDGEVVSVTLIATDIWERKQIEAEREALIKELELRNEELQSFNYSVSHDLKSPLITIRGFLGFVQESAEAGNTERLRADLGRVDKAAGRMQRLLDDLLDLSRVGRVAHPPEETSFEAIAREAASNVQGRLEQRGARLAIDDDLPVVHGDRRRLAQVVQNLLENAVKFMGDQPEPRIRVGHRGQDGAEVFFVEDNGQGIEPQHLERVLGVFQKLDPATDGTGLGLSLAKRIVDVHGGRIWLESEGLGHGTRVCFTLGSGLDF
jgi:PAS domain S-box-containing protein